MHRRRSASLTLSVRCICSEVNRLCVQASLLDLCWFPPGLRPCLPLTMFSLRSHRCTLCLRFDLCGCGHPSRSCAAFLRGMHAVTVRALPSVHRSVPCAHPVVRTRTRGVHHPPHPVLCRSPWRLVLPCVAYFCVAGPFRGCWLRLGYTPQEDASSRLYQVIDVRVPKNLEALVPGDVTTHRTHARAGSSATRLEALETTGSLSAGVLPSGKRRVQGAPRRDAEAATRVAPGMDEKGEEDDDSEEDDMVVLDEAIADASDVPDSEDEEKSSFDTAAAAAGDGALPEESSATTVVSAVCLEQERGAALRTYAGVPCHWRSVFQFVDLMAAGLSQVLNTPDEPPTAADWPLYVAAHADPSWTIAFAAAKPLAMDEDAVAEACDVLPASASFSPQTGWLRRDAVPNLRVAATLMLCHHLLCHNIASAEVVTERIEETAAGAAPPAVPLVAQAIMSRMVHRLQRTSLLTARPSAAPPPAAVPVRRARGAGQAGAHEPEGAHVGIGDEEQRLGTAEDAAGELEAAL
ncbi:hypothetical protein EON66_04640 [archaeon]|nr:MAG: hypothetical protein EON66_04640 [archaeon]